MKHLQYIVFICLSLLAAGSVYAASDTASDQSDSPGTQWSETVESLKSYTADQREEALEAGKRTLEAMDRQIDKLEAWTSEHWGSLSDEARKQKTEALSNMRQQRSKVAEWYGGMKHSSADAWDSVKQGFIKSYDKLRNTVQSLQSEADKQASE